VSSFCVGQYGTDQHGSVSVACFRICWVNKVTATVEGVSRTQDARLKQKWKRLREDGLMVKVGMETAN